MVYIHQYRVCIIYKPDPDLYIADWLSKNNQEITGMNINMHAISTSFNIQNRQHQKGCRPPRAKNIHNTRLANKKDEVEYRIKHYWPIGIELTMIDCIAMKGRRIEVPFSIVETNTGALAQQPHGC